jgi:hypothetical protein
VIEMDKPFSAKAFYSEVESLYRHRVSSYIPFVNAMINALGLRASPYTPLVNGKVSSFGLEIAKIQLNELYFNGREFFLNPKEVNPEREVFEDLNPSEDFLRFLAGLYPGYYKDENEDTDGGDDREYKESRSEAVRQIIEDLSDLGIDEELNDYVYREDHTLFSQIFIRPKGSVLKVSDVSIIGRLYSNLGGTHAYNEEIEGWDGRLLDDINFVIAVPKDKSPKEEDYLNPSFSYDYSFYSLISEAASVILSVPLVEVLLESGVSKHSREVNIVPSLGRVVTEKNIYLRSNVILTLPSLEYIVSPFSGKPYYPYGVTEEDVKNVIAVLPGLKYQVSNEIINPGVRELFLEEMDRLISDAKLLFARYWEKGASSLNFKGIEVTPGTDHVVADSPESLKPVLDLVFDRVKESYEYIYPDGEYKPEDRTKPFTPHFSFAVSNGGRSKEKLSKSPFVAGDTPFSRILSFLPEILVVESTSIQRENFFGKKAVKATSTVYLYPVGPCGKEIRENLEETGGSAYDSAIFGVWVKGESGFKNLSPILNPMYSLHAYLLPLLPALFYYGYASHLVLDPSPVKRGGMVWIEPRISREIEGEVGEVEEGFFSSFSERVLKTLDRLFKEVWEGTLEKEHEEYIKKAESFLNSLSPSEDRIFGNVTSEFTSGDGSGVEASLNLAVKFRPDERFTSSLKDFLISAASLLHEVGDGVGVSLIFL